MRAPRLRRLSLLLIAVTTQSPAWAIDIASTWTGAGGTTGWSNAANWSPNAVPRNVGSVNFNVTLPATGVTVTFDVAGSSTLGSLNLGQSSVLRPQAGANLTISGDALIAGVVDATGGNFTASAGTFSSELARIYAAGGSHVTVAAPSYSSKGLAFSDGTGFSSTTFTTPLFKASGNATILDLGSVRSIDAGFSQAGNDTNRHEITASAGATLDLSGVSTVTAPSAYYDWIRFTTTGAGTQLLLSGLSKVSSTGSGRTVFEASDKSVLRLPTLSTISSAIFSASGGATLTTSSPASYDSRALIASDGTGFSSSTYAMTLFSAAGAGTLLDLSSLQSINAGFAQAGNDTNRHEISASAGATLNLSGVSTVTAPSAYYDWIRFATTGAGTQLLLSGLSKVSSTGSGRTVFEANDKSVLNLPGLSTISSAIFSASGGATLSTSSPASYDSRALIASDGTGFSSSTYAMTLFSATGAGTLLDLSSLQSINAGFAQAGNDTNRHEIAASAGATLNLAGVTSVITPVSSSDWLRFSASGNGTHLNLASLKSTLSAGSGQLLISASDGARIDTGGLAIGTHYTTIDLSHGATLAMSGNLGTTGVGAAAVTLASADDRLVIGGNADLGTAIKLVSAAQATVELGGNLSFAHTAAASLKLGQAIVQLDGLNRSQMLEVGGLDVSTFTQLLSNDNFGFGQLVVGGAGHVSQVHLVDAVNNGNRGAHNAPEALYLFGLGNGSAGLRILYGSTLYLDGLPAYALVNGTMTDLYSLFPAGQTRIAFDQGTLAQAVPEPASWAQLLAGAALLCGVACRRRTGA